MLFTVGLYHGKLDTLLNKHPGLCSCGDEDPHATIAVTEDVEMLSGRTLRLAPIMAFVLGMRIINSKLQSSLNPYRLEVAVAESGTPRQTLEIAST